MDAAEQFCQETKVAAPAKAAAFLIAWAAIFAMVGAQFAHRFFEGDAAWLIGWSVQDGMIVALAAMATTWAPGWRLKSALLFFTAWRAWIFVVGVADSLGWPSDALWPIEAAILAVWIVKQATLLPLPASDPYTPDRYMIAVARPENGWGLLNIVRPGTCVLYGGRAIIGGGRAWRVKRRVFVETPYRGGGRESEYVFLDTGIPVSAETNARLSRLTGRSFIPIVRDCSRLDPGVSVAALVWRKWKEKGFK